MEAQANRENPFNNQKQLDGDTYAGQSEAAMIGFGRASILSMLTLTFRS